MSHTPFIVIKISLQFFNPLTSNLNTLASLSNPPISILAGGVDCGYRVGNYSGCMAWNATCMWSNNSGAIPMDPWCPLNVTTYNSTSRTINWGPQSGQTYYNLTGGQLINAGCCLMKMDSGGGGMQIGCGSFDANYSGCVNSQSRGVQGCTWKANDKNQNPMCWIKTLAGAQMRNPGANTTDIGCCEQLGCWNFKGVQTASNNCTSALNGVCNYVAQCPEPDGCCTPRSCSDPAINTQEKCTQLSTYGQPCVWNSNRCEMPSGGGCGFYSDISTCLAHPECMWNGTNCTFGMMASGGGGGFMGGTMFAEKTKCWFADNKQGICGNISGCIYCTNTTTQLNNISSACYGYSVGRCQGHDPRTTNINTTSGQSVTIVDAGYNFSDMTCGDLRTQQICNCGPLPYCVWTNSSATAGQYCTSGAKSNADSMACTPPVTYCEHPNAKNNQTLCLQLANNYYMPCKWDNVTNKNCTFKMENAFGGGGGGSGSIDFTSIGTETSCVAGGGTWKEEFYLEGNSVIPSSWCEKGAMFSFSSVQSFGNKGNCDSDCWACEFNSSGERWSNVASATGACLGSSRGICRWKNDTHAPNGQGWCDYPPEMSFGNSGDCNSDCKACEFQASPWTACAGSSSGCKWFNDSSSLQGGYCMSSSKKSCSSDCFSCYEQSQCSNSSVHVGLNCSWDNNMRFCKPSGFTGEICFNGKDDDNDGSSDCADPDCSFDQFCGGASMGGGGNDCKRLNITSCNITAAPSGKNCTLITPTWGGQPYCDFPGSNCWLFENNSFSCTANWTNATGCIFKNATINNATFTASCDINKTAANICFSNAASFNSSNCTSTSSNCEWVNDTFNARGGRCEFKLFSSCNAQTTSAGCSGVGNCTWRVDSFSLRGGFCEPVCFSLNSGDCNSNSLCKLRDQACEPEMFSGGGGVGVGGGGGGGGGVAAGCHRFDNNQGACQTQNMSCAWNSFSFNVSQGVCNDLGQQMMFAGMDMSPPKILGQDSADTSVTYIDIRQFGVKDNPGSLGFGAAVSNITGAAVCRGYPIGNLGPTIGQPTMGSGNATTKFYWYLDTNKNRTDGCNSTSAGGANDTGYEFLIKYVVTSVNGTVNEVKSFYKCSSRTWVLTNVPLSSNRQFMCSINMPSAGESIVGGVMILVDKENLKSFAEYNQTAPTRVFLASANDTYNENSPQDSVTAGFYTPGSADFKFVDCSNPDVKDAKCKNFQKFGFNILEDCKNGLDDDGDGLVDCADPKCRFTPVCASTGQAFNFSANSSDVQAPTVMFSQVDTLPDGAFIKFDTDEPANGSVAFYGNDSSCSLLNVTLVDLGDPSVIFDDYKPFHMAPMDFTTVGQGWTSYSDGGLNNNTQYFYKTMVCDPSGNCATSACQNFTTKTERSYKPFVLKMKLPAGYNVTIPALNYSGNFTKTITNATGGNTTYEVGVKTYSNVTRNVNVTVNCGTQSLTFVGVDVLKPKDIDMSGAFICDPSNAGGPVLGMNSTSKAWNQVMGDLGMGGSSDYLKMTFPVSYTSGATLNWCTDEASNCTNVNQYANCSNGGTGKTDCKVPTSLGFSAYQLGSNGGSTPSSGSGGGGGGGAATPLNATNITNMTGPTAPVEGEEESGTGDESDSSQPGAGEQQGGVTGEPEGGNNSWIIWLIAVVVVVVIATVLIVAKKKNK